MASPPLTRRVPQSLFLTISSLPRLAPQFNFREFGLRDDAYERLIRIERRALLQRAADVRARVEMHLQDSGYTRCELHYRNKRAVHILRVRSVLVDPSAP